MEKIKSMHEPSKSQPFHEDVFLSDSSSSNLGGHLMNVPDDDEPPQFGKKQKVPEMEFTKEEARQMYNEAATKKSSIVPQH